MNTSAQNGQQIGQKPVNQPMQTPEKPKVNYWMISTIILLFILLSGGFNTLITKTQIVNNQKTEPQSAPTVFLPTSLNNKEFSESYSVEYPGNFFVTRRDYRTFGVAEDGWKEEMGHFPEATIQEYTNVIPDGMSLKDWLNGVGDPNPPIGEGNPKACKEFLDKLRQKVKLGDLFDIEYLKEGYCLYHGIHDIKETTVAGLPAIEFSTEAVSSAATHTIIAYKNQSGVILLYDIYYTITGMSDEKDRTIEAYKSFLRTFSLRQK